MVEHHGNLSEEAIAPCRSPLFTTWNILGGGAEEARWRTGEEASQDGALPEGDRVVNCAYCAVCDVFPICANGRNVLSFCLVVTQRNATQR